MRQKNVEGDLAQTHIIKFFAEVAFFRAKKKILFSWVGNAWAPPFPMALWLKFYHKLSQVKILKKL